MRIRKDAVTPLPEQITGSIINGTNFTDKEHNTYNAKTIDELVKDVYSTTEQVVGTWIDGKTLYRKCFKSTVTGSANVWEYVQHNIANVDMIMIKDAHYKHANAWYKAPNDIFMEMGVDTVTYSYYLTNDAVVGGEYLVVLEYTKTTD